MPDLREKVLAMSRPYGLRAYGAITGDLDYDKLALAVAALVLTDYAERMERAGQSAAALGATLLAETLK